MTDEIVLNCRQNLAHYVQEYVGMFGSECQTWSQSNCLHTTATALNSFLNKSQTC